MADRDILAPREDGAVNDAHPLALAIFLRDMCSEFYTCSEYHETLSKELAVMVLRRLFADRARMKSDLNMLADKAIEAAGLAEAAIVDLEQDGRRLDWLARTGVAVEKVEGQWYAYLGDKLQTVGQDLREVIDSTMEVWP